VPPLEVADLSREDRLVRVGLALPVPGRKTWPPYQRVGETLWREGWPGLLTPSAARATGLVLCLFIDDSLLVPAEPVPPPTIVTEPPAAPPGLRT